MTKQEFIKKFSKIETTFEDEFKAEYNSPELIWVELEKYMETRPPLPSNWKELIEDKKDG